MPISDFQVKSLVFSSGDEVQLAPGSLLLLVGPNNSGKSVALREIGTWFAPPHEQAGSRLVIQSAHFEDVTANDLFEAMKTRYPTAEHPGEQVIFSIGGGRRHQMGRAAPLEAWYEVFYPSLIQRLDTETRLTYSNPVGRVDVFGSDVPTAGIHWLQKDEAVYKQVSATVSAAFGADLIINWGGAMVQLANENG